MAYVQPFPRAAPQDLQSSKGAFGPDLAVRLICPQCQDPHPNIVEEFGCGDLVCGSCGLVLGGRVVDTRSEWRVSNNKKRYRKDKTILQFCFVPVFCCF